MPSLSSICFATDDYEHPSWLNGGLGHSETVAEGFQFYRHPINGILVFRKRQKS